jgi:hypothetical protein
MRAVRGSELHFDEISTNGAKERLEDVKTFF